MALEDYMMRSTPPLPDWIKAFRTPSYTNIWELVPDEPRLYGTESLYGDWDAELLLLAKDFAPRWVVEARIARGERAYRHQEWQPDSRVMGAQTNKNLYELAEAVPCTKLYGSALVGLLRNDEHTSGTLPDLGSVHPYARQVLNWVIGEMPQLRGIACLGEDAWEVTTSSLGLPRTSWAATRDGGHPIQINGLLVFALRHPSRHQAGKSTTLAEWQAMRRALNSGSANLPPSESPVTGSRVPVHTMRSVTRSRSPADWPCDGPTPRVRSLTPRAEQKLPAEGTGRRVALDALLRDGGATERELVDALLAGAPGTWDSFDKVNDGYGVIRNRDGWGIYTDPGSGRTFAYRSPEDLRHRIERARKGGFIT